KLQFPASASRKVANHIEGDAIEPSGKLAGLAIARRRQENAQEHLLAQVLDQLLLTDQMEQEAGHRALPAAHQGREGGGLAALPSGKEIRVVVVHEWSRRFLHVI